MGNHLFAKLPYCSREKLANSDQSSLKSEVKETEKILQSFRTYFVWFVLIRKIVELIKAENFVK